MKREVCIVGVFALVAASIIGGCSREDREEAMERVGKATRALNGSDKSVPDIVREQQRKERARQNSEWTPENQAKHPIEYCRAQLEELEKFSTQLEVSSHKWAVNRSTAQRKISESETRIKALQKFLEEAKTAYREAEKTDHWPMQVNGFDLSKEKAQEKIVEASQKVDPAKQVIATQRRLLVILEKKLAQVAEEKKRIVMLRERIQTTINDLNARTVLNGEKDIEDALNVINDSIYDGALNMINDSMGDIGVDVSDPSIDDLIAPSESISRQGLFDQIMSQP